VQRALRALVEEGLVTRTQGSGTFVARGRGAIDAPLHLRFLGESGEPRFLPLYPKVLAPRRIADRGAWSQWLRQKDADIVGIDRKLSVNGEFVVFNRFYFNADTFPEIAMKPLAALDGANLKQLLGTSFNMPITNVQQRVSLVRFTPDICKATDVKPGTRSMLVESFGRAGRGNAVYFLEAYIPPNSRRLDVSAT